mgnify:CR=1 FL=1|jgi:hypothetical protein
MNDYLLLFHGGGSEDNDLSPEEMQKVMMKWSVWITSLRDAGIFKGGDPLEKEARTVRGPERRTDPLPNRKSLWAAT